MVAPKPSSGAVMGVRTLEITIISAMDLKAGDVYLVASLSDGQEQRSPVHKKDSTDPDPWWSHKFVFTVDEEAVRTGRLMFKINKVKGEKRPIGEADVSVRDLLGERGASDEKPKVMSREVRSSSKRTMAVLKFSYHFSEQLTGEAPPAAETITGDPAAAAPSLNSALSYPPPAPRAVPPPLEDEPVMGYPDVAAPPADEPVTVPPAAAGPPASNSAPSYPPPTPRAVPPPSADEPVTGYPAAATLSASNSAASYLPPAQDAAPPPASNSVAPYAPPVPGAAPPPSTNEPLMGYPVAVAPPSAWPGAAPPPPPALYPPPPPWAAPYSQSARPANAVPTYGHPMPVHVHPPVGHEYPAPPLPAMYPPPPPWAAPYSQPARPANTVPTYGHPMPVHVHPPVGHEYPAPPLPAMYPPPPPWAAPYSQPARPANAVPTYGHPMLAHAHHSAGHEYPAPPLPAMYPPPSPWAAQHIQPAYRYGPPALAHPPAGRGYPAPPGEDFGQRLTIGLATEMLSDLFGSFWDA